MDRPLLALTRGPPGGPPGRSQQDAGAENMRQLIQLRWIAVTGQLIAILVAEFALGVRLPLTPMLSIVALLALANLVLTLTLRRVGVVRVELLLALLLDMAALTAQLYFSGGATNPFVSLYLLQVVLGAILLTSGMVALLVVLASLCFAFLSVAHLPLGIPSPAWGTRADLIQLGQWVSFALVATLLVLFINRISRNLRSRDAYAAELGQRAAEEDGIVRMGLFASGAAHELGTPLSSLSVLLADWQRHPAVAGDAQLNEEISEALGELQRCKQIVSNILHSAGQSRGEAMSPAPVDTLIEEVTSAWASAHPGVPLTVQGPASGRAMIAADPSLRQAVWSLLENAAEQSPSGITLSAEVEDPWLVISVLDRGQGFSRQQLERVGKLYQSNKGPGHGLGLFLASNVARRLGGRIEASNLEGGGAAVRLMLPLAFPQGNQEAR